VTAAPRTHFTYEEYLAFERDSGLKHEFDRGEIFATAGGSRRHNALALRVGAALDRARADGCTAFQSDQRVRVLATGRATYPDVSMVCGSIEGDPADPSGPTISNPTVVVEVLSPSTEQEDRGAKWHHYQQIPSLETYVLVSQDTPRIEVFRRQGGSGWTYEDYTGGSIEIRGVTIQLAELYRGLPD
jgi:Uma2 family endonuclease